MTTDDFDVEIDAVRSLLQQAYADAGGHGQVDLDAPILSLGIDSIGLVGLNGDLREAFGHGISIEQVVAGATGRDVVTYLRRRTWCTGDEPT